MTDAPAPAPETPTDVYTMTPEQAGARLAEIGAQYKAAQTPADAVAPPPPGTPATTPAQAAARLAQLRADPQWRTRVLTGSPTQVREFQQLTALAASHDEAPDVMFETVDAVSNPSALRRSDYETALDGLRENNNLPAITEQYLRDVDAGLRSDAPTEGDGLVFKEAKERWLRDPAVRAKYLAGDTATVRQLNNMNRVVALAAQDGQPASDLAIKILTDLGLR
jgi:hypothetical protein